MQSKKFKTEPVLLTGTYTTNILNPGTTTGGTNCTGAPYDKLSLIIYAITFTNVTSGAITIRLYCGATGTAAAGTELFKDMSIPANSQVTYQYPGGMNLAQADFIVGGASAANSINIQFFGEIYVGA